MVAGIFAVLAALACLGPESRSLSQAALLMPALFGAGAASPTAGSRLVSEELALQGAEPGATIHIRRPVTGRHPALVVALGLHPADPTDPRVQALLDGLATRGIVAALVESPALDDDTLTADAPADLVAAFELVSNQPFVQRDYLGFLGFSVGASLSLLAATDNGIAARVRLVEGLGPYASLENVARATLTGGYSTANGRQPWHPDALTRTAVPENLVELLASPSDRDLLLQALRTPTVGNPALADLSPSGQAVRRILAATDAQSFDAAFQSLGFNQTAQLLALSPIASASEMRAPVYLMVDKHDPLIPPVESIALAQAVEGSGHSVYLSQFDLFRHVEPTRLQLSVSVARDVLRLFWQVHAVLRRLET
jgi:dienelactone hydrolase